MNAVTPLRPRKAVQTIDEHIVEIMSDSGEGAQKCGQSFGSIAARMGNGVWTVEIIPAEIQPPARSVAGASGNRIRIGSAPVTNWGDEANLVVAFNEQVVLGRHRLNALADDCVILLEDMWASHDDEGIRARPHDDRQIVAEVHARHGLVAGHAQRPRSVAGQPHPLANADQEAQVVGHFLQRRGHAGLFPLGDAGQSLVQRRPVDHAHFVRAGMGHQQAPAVG